MRGPLTSRGQRVAVDVGVVAEHARRADGERRVLVGAVGVVGATGASLTALTVMVTVADVAVGAPSLAR